MPDPSAGKQELILNTALRLFVERGFFGTPTSMISKEAGVATGTLFFYFRTKEDLIDTLYRQIKAEAAEAMCRGLDLDLPAMDRFRIVGSNAVSWGLEHPEKFRFMEQFAHTPFISASAQEEGMSRFLFLKDLVLDGIREGSIRDCDPELALFMMASAVSGLIARASAAKTKNERERIISQGLDIVWGGLKGKPRGRPNKPGTAGKTV